MTDYSTHCLHDRRWSGHTHTPTEKGKQRKCLAVRQHIASGKLGSKSQEWPFAETMTHQSYDPPAHHSLTSAGLPPEVGYHTRKMAYSLPALPLLPHVVS